MAKSGEKQRAWDGALGNRRTAMKSKRRGTEGEREREEYLFLRAADR
jgi:hypothetical protein